MTNNKQQREKTTMKKGTTKQTTKQTQTLEQANAEGRKQLSAGTTAEEIFKILLKNKGKSFTPLELASMLGDTVTPKNVRNACQKEQLSKHQNAVIERKINNKKYWIYLSKLTGGKNTYTLRNAQS